MTISNSVISILSNWDTASEKEMVEVKRCLMPDDDISNLKLRVASHPYSDQYGRMYIAFFDVNVFCDGIHICDIRLDCKTRKAYYAFLGISEL